MSRRHATSRYRWSVASRVLAASVGGYGLVSVLAAALALSLPMPRLEAVMTAIMVSFLAYAAIIMTIFHTRRVSRIWIWLCIAAVPPSVVTMLLLPEATPW